MSTKTTEKCPVCGWEITDRHVATVGGRQVAVCCDDCVREAEAGKLAGASQG
jgi:hypothetical protein